MINFGVDPVTFELGTFSFRWYGMFLTLAVVWLIFWMWLQVKKGAQFTWMQYYRWRWWVFHQE